MGCCCCCKDSRQCVSHSHNKCRRMTMISFSRNRGLNQSPLQTNERQLAPSHPSPSHMQAPRQGHNREQARTTERVRERERASANRQHFSFIKAKKAFLRGACRHDSQSTKRHCEKFPNHNSWQGACNSWRSLKFQLTQVSCLHSLSLSYSHSLRSLELRLHLSSLLWTQLWSLFLFAFS